MKSKASMGARGRRLALARLPGARERNAAHKSLESGEKHTLAHLVKAMGRGEDLAGLSVSAGKVLVVSEESAALWAGRRDKLGIGDHALILRPWASPASLTVPMARYTPISTPYGIRS